MIQIKRRNVKFLVIHEMARNFSLIQDIGMIPFYLHRIYHFNSKILTYRNERTYPYLEEHCNGVELDFF